MTNTECNLKPSSPDSGVDQNSSAQSANNGDDSAGSVADGEVPGDEDPPDADAEVPGGEDQHPDVEGTLEEGGQPQGQDEPLEDDDDDMNGACDARTHALREDEEENFDRLNFPAENHPEMGQLDDLVVPNDWFWPQPVLQILHLFELIFCLRQLR